MANCTLSRNWADVVGGGIFNEAEVVLADCIWWGNSDLGGEDESAQIANAGSVDVDYSCVQGWTGQFGGIGNFGDDPLFDSGSLRLSGSSPCIGAGSDLATNICFEAPGAPTEDPCYDVPSETLCMSDMTMLGNGTPDTGQADIGFHFYAHYPEDENFLGYDDLRSGSSADPVNTSTGNFTHSETDLSIASRADPLVFSRFYNAADTAEGPLGPGWTHSYNIALDPNGPCDQVSVRWGDGQIDFWRDPNDGTYPPSVASLYDELSRDPNSGIWTVTRQNQDVYEFDAEGRLSSITDKNGNTVTLGYNVNGLLETITGPAGRALTLSYNGDDLLESVTDFASPPRVVQYSYTGGRLTQVTDAFGRTIDYTYDANGYLETINDQRGMTVVTNEYDADGRVLRQWDGNNNLTEFSYDTRTPNETVITRTVTVQGEPRALEAKHPYEPRYKRQLAVENPLIETVTYAYDDNFNRDSVTDRNGNVTVFTYDEHGNVTRAEEADDPNDPHDGGVTVVEYNDSNAPQAPTKKIDVLDHITDWTYDGFGNVVTAVRLLDGGARDSVSKSWTYNAHGQPLTETDERGNVHEWVYDPNGLLTGKIDWDYSDPNNPAEVSHAWYGHDELWRRTWVTDGRGSGPEDPNHTTYYEYDKADRVIEIKGPPVSSDPNGIAQIFEYDEIGNRTAVTDGNGNRTRYHYDNNGNLIRVESPLDGDPNGVVTRYEYDELNRKVRELDAKGDATTFKYDDADRLIEKRDAEDNVWTYDYDAHGNLLSETDPSGVTLGHEYDAMNRRIRTYDELGNERLHEYDQAGQLVSQIDADGNETQFSYDALGRLTCVIDAEGGWTEYTYDEAGNLIQIEDANENVISVREYDALNRLVKAYDGNGNFYQYGYDEIGNQTWVRDAKAQETFLTYDAESRLTRIDYPNGQYVAYTYDNNGNLLTLSDPDDPNAVTSFTYDEQSRSRSSTDSFGKQVQYDYDEVGNRTKLIYPGGEQVDYIYDNANRLTTITDWVDPNPPTQYTYNGMRIETVTYPNSVVETQSYDLAGRLESIVTADPNATTLLSHVWNERDGEGNPIDVTETGTLQPTLTQSVDEYEYDADNRLVESSQGAYEYDANGNLTSRTVDGVTTTFSYDSEDRLVSQTTDGNTVQHIYDGAGNRITRIDNGAETRYVLDYGRSMSHVLCETDASGDISAYYILGPQLVARIDSDGTRRYYHANDIGSVVALTDPNGVPSDRYAYTPYGLAAHEGATEDNPFTYVGALGVMTEDGDLYFMRARFYDPDTGRFLGKDPVEGALTEPHELHRYLYAVNNPLTFADPEGTSSAEFAWDVGKKITWKSLLKILDWRLLSFGGLSKVVTSPFICYQPELARAIAEGSPMQRRLQEATGGRLRMPSGAEYQAMMGDVRRSGGWINYIEDWGDSLRERYNPSYSPSAPRRAAQSTRSEGAVQPYSDRSPSDPQVSRTPERNVPRISPIEVRRKTRMAKWSARYGR